MANEDKATRYHRLQRRAALMSGAAGALLLAAFSAAGGAVWLRELVERITQGSFAVSIALYVVVLALAAEFVQWPFAYYRGVTLERRYDLSTAGPGRWWIDRGRAMLIGLPLAVGAALVIYALLRWWPHYWWMASAGIFTIVMVVLAQLAPVLLMPIFYRFKPLDRPALVERLTSLARRAGTDVLGVFEWRLSDRTRRANAALTGLGRTRRILLSDTLLAEYSDDEIEVILAHELAHHVHRDIWVAIAIDALLVAAGFLVGDRALTLAIPWLGLTGKSDLAGLPVLLLVGWVVSLLLVPVANGISRRHERRADLYALTLTGNPEAFVSSMKRLAVQNLAEDQPPRLVEVLYHSHPSTSARIAAAQTWMKGSR